MASGGEINGEGSIRDILGDEFKDQDKIKFEINGKKFVIGNIGKDEDGNFSDPDIGGEPIADENGEIIGYKEAIIDGNLDSIRLNDLSSL